MFFGRWQSLPATVFFVAWGPASLVTLHRHCEGGTTVAVPATAAPKPTRIVSPVPARGVLLSSSVLQLTPPACGHPL